MDRDVSLSRSESLLSRPYRAVADADGVRRSGEPTQLPKSHSCFNRIDIPVYTSYEELEKKLSFAVENTIGFGLE